MSSGITCTKDGIRESLKGMMSRTNTVASFLQRVIYPSYIKAQEQRWETENESQGATWTQIASASYLAWKRRKFASAPGGGEKLMVATSDTLFAATNRSGNSLKIITNDSFVVGIDDTSIPYAKCAAEKRPIMLFSDDQKNEWKSQIARWITGTKK